MFDLRCIVFFHKPLRVCTGCAIITSVWVWNKMKVSANQKTSYCNGLETDVYPCLVMHCEIQTGHIFHMYFM